MISHSPTIATLDAPANGVNPVGAVKQGGKTAQSYALPCPFPPGKVWAAIRGGVVMNMVYMTLPEGLSFTLHRNRSRAALAKDGVVWTGEVVKGRFVPTQTTDIRHTGQCNTARVAT